MRHGNDFKDEESTVSILDRLAQPQLQASITPSAPSDSVNSLPLMATSQHEEEHRHSQWEYESTTPMTTRPHFQRGTPSPVLKRIRSKSLGAEIEACRRQQYDATASLLLPPLLSGGELYQGISTNGHSPLLGNKEKLHGTSLTTSSAADIGPSQQQLKQQHEEESNPIWICILYGMINATIVLPVLMSFGSIIYRDNAFAPYMPVLVKLTVVSGMVHQTTFSTFSSLPFAIGQVQDAGLIFLSSMASELVKYCRVQHGNSDDIMLATVTVGLALGTALLGCGIVIVGKLRLGQYVQLLPTSVVGGYLAYIGWFCGMSGIELMAGSSQLTAKIFADKFIFVLPGIAGGVAIYMAVTKLCHMAALPISILLEIVLFYFILWATGTTVEEATDSGWIRQMDPAPSLIHTWDYLRLDKVAWSAFPHLALTELSMIFVVALSSSLDVAAIELELKRPLNYNHELKMVGLSNIISGMTGGYTGSYIFSQSIFSLRAGIRSRLAGYVLALCQFVVLVLPVPILAYVPNFFFGSLLAMICIDLMYEWLWDVRSRITSVEYVICLSTFGLIHLLGVEYGILAGVGLYLCGKRLGFDVGVAKFSTHSEVEEIMEDSLNDLHLEIDIPDRGGTLERYGTI